MAIDRSSMRSSLAKKQETSHSTKDDRGKFRGIFREDIEGLQLWKVSEGDHEFDFVPYSAGPNDPDKKISPGDFTYVLIVWVHRGIGPSEDSYICQARTNGKRCPVCEYQTSLKDTDASDEEIKRWNPTRRTLYNVVVYDSEKEQSKGVQILDIAHYYLEQELQVQSRPRSRGGAATGEKIFFASPDKDGKTIAVTREGSRRNTKYIGIKFLDRDYDLADDIIEAAHCLDEIVHWPSYDEVKDALDSGLANPVSSVPEDDIPSEGARRRGRSVAPSKEATPQSQEKEVKEEKKEVKEEKKVATLVCPADGVFGIDIEKLGACGKCEVWDDCSVENTRIMNEKRAARSSEGGGRLKR